MKKTVILTTTINVPFFLKGICNNIIQYKHDIKKIEILVLGDVKTPKKTYKFCKKLQDKTKIQIKYIDVNEQDRFLKKKFNNFIKFFPRNDAIRKLIGFLYFVGAMPDRIILIDDDNYIDQKITEDFLKGHMIVGENKIMQIVSSKNNWPNIYKYFEVKNNIPIYPRGFPWKKRFEKLEKIKVRSAKAKIIANCGFILGDPDIDAVSRLFYNIETLKVKTKKHMAIDNHNYFPLNDQNLCIEKLYIPLYFKPLAAGRNSDIWTSYLLSKISFNFNEKISYGPPHLRQIRNKHDFWKDYDLEKIHNIATDDFVDILKNINLKNKSNRLLAFIEICVKSIKYINIKLKKIDKNKILVKTRHYHAISDAESKFRKSESLKYIKKYFIEYLQWLREIKKIKYLY